MGEGKALSSPLSLVTALSVLVAIASAFWAWQQEQEVAQRDRRIGQLTSALQDAQQKLSAAASTLTQQAKPDIPIAVGYRHALLGAGLVAILKNNSFNQIEVAVELSSPATGERRNMNLVFESNQVQEIGQAQGWPLAPGQHIRLVNNSYRPADYDIPAR